MCGSSLHRSFEEKAKKGVGKPVNLTKMFGEKKLLAESN